MSDRAQDPWSTRDYVDYLGDGVYVAWNGYAFVLRINDHRNEDSEIFLEPGVLERLNEFAARMTSQAKTSVAP